MNPFSPQVRIPQVMGTPNISRDDLIKLVRQVQSSAACVIDFDALMNRLEKKTGSPEIGRLIFDPPGGTPLSAEEIADRVLNQ